jgi:hypothetical protein
MYRNSNKNRHNGIGLLPSSGSYEHVVPEQYTWDEDTETRTLFRQVRGSNAHDGFFSISTGNGEVRIFNTIGMRCH